MSSIPTGFNAAARTLRSTRNRRHTTGSFPQLRSVHISPWTCPLVPTSIPFEIAARNKELSWGSSLIKGSVIFRPSSRCRCVLVIDRTRTGALRCSMCQSGIGEPVPNVWNPARISAGYRTIHRIRFRQFTTTSPCRTLNDSRMERFRSLAWLPEDQTGGEDSQRDGDGPVGNEKIFHLGCRPIEQGSICFTPSPTQPDDSYLEHGQRRSRYLD